MKIKTKQMRKGFTLVELLVVIAIIAALAAMATPAILKQRKKADQATATSNARQIGILLLEFDNDFNAYPSDSSAERDVDLNEYTGSSNAYLGQLLAGGYVDSEEIFFTKGGSSASKQPDNVYSTASNTLEAGECGFAYTKDLSASDKSSTPVLMTPMVDSQTFAENPFGGRAVILRVDGSAVALRLSKKFKAKLPSGATLFDTGPDSVWGSVEPEVVTCIDPAKAN